MPTGAERKMFKAAAYVCGQLNVPVNVHCCPGLRSQVDFFAREKVNPIKIAFAHPEICCWDDIRYAVGNGFSLNFTNFAGENVIPEDITVAQIAWLAKAGYDRQIMISRDFAYFIRGNKLVPHFPHAYDYIFSVVVPKLVSAGVKLSQIERIFSENTRRYLSF